MDINLLRKEVENGSFDKDFKYLYNETENSKTRYLKAINRYLDFYKEDTDMYLLSAPGRTEVGGNHTDHQHGRTLTGGVNLDVIAVVCKTDDNTVAIKSEGFKEDVVDISASLEKCEGNGKTSELIKGIAFYLKQKGFNIGGFRAYTTSNVLKGSGLSSSAAFEVLICNIFKSLYNLDINELEIAKISQKAENEYFGKPCGLLDQMACSLGGFTAIDFKDVENPKVEKIDFDLKKYNTSLVIVNTGGNHSDLTDDYADIPKECKAVANFFNKNYLREVDFKEFLANIKNLREKVSDRAVLRAIHFFNEDLRAAKEAEALKNNNFEEFLNLVKQSGNSSYKYLQNVYSNANVAEQGIGLALALTEMYLNGRGACRVHGGGFAGTIQAFVPNDILNEYIEKIEAVFGEGSAYVLTVRPAGGYKLSLKK